MKKVLSFVLMLAIVFSCIQLPPAAAVAAPAPKKAIYILPGFTASRLYSPSLGGADLWIAPALAAEVAKFQMTGQGEMINDASGTGMTAYPDKTRDKSGILGVYTPWITSITAGLVKYGLTDTYKVEFFPYNWVMDINPVAVDLENDIREKGYESVILVAHSNAGALASVFIAKPENKKLVERAIILGGTFMGTVGALEMPEAGAVNLFYDVPVLHGLVQTGYEALIKPISKSWVKAWAKNSPNTYQLFPTSEYIRRAPILYRTSTGMQPIFNADEYYALLTKSTNLNPALVSGSERSLRYLDDVIYQNDVLKLWEDVDVTLVGCDYGLLTPYSAIYSQVGSKSIYEGTLYNKEGDGLVTGFSLNGEGFLKYVNVPYAHHVLILLDPRFTTIIPDLVFGKTVASVTTYPAGAKITSSVSQTVGMSDMIRVEMKSNDSLTQTATNKALLTKISQGSAIVAQAVGDMLSGFTENNFVYNSWETDEYATNVVCYIPKSGYTMEVSTGNEDRSASDVIVSIETLDPSGAILSRKNYQITGADPLTGTVFTLNPGSTTPTVKPGAKLTALSTETYKQNWQFVYQTEILAVNASLTPRITGVDASSMKPANYNWTSSNPDVATVSPDGMITAVSPGTATIAAAARDTSYKIAFVKVKTSHTVTFDSQGGTARAAVKLNYNDKVKQPANPTRTGHVFSGWYLNGAPYDFKARVTSDITLTAVWDANKMNVNYDVQGGIPEPDAVMVDYGTAAPKPGDPIKEGFAFLGWYVGATAYDFNKPVTTNLKLTAKWAQITFTVTFDSQGGTARAASKVNYGANVKQPANPTKTGHVFGGWYLEDEPYDFSLPVTSDITLTAVWNANGLTVNYDAQGGSPVPDAVTVSYGTAAPKPDDPVKEGFTFLGWYVGATAYDFNKAVTANLKLTAKWAQITYTVTFDSQGGTARAASKVNYGATVTRPANPTKTGHVFNGWYLDGAPYDFNAPVNADITLTAVWNANGLNVNYDAQGGSPVPSAVTVGYGTTAPRPDDPVKEGFTFLGWYVGATAYDFNKAVTTNLTLTAKWAQITYTVTFDSQGGTARAASKVNYGATVTRPANPTKTGYVFNGWYLDGAPYDFNAPVNADITLTAVWN